eukprot:4959940-Pyramimonas_sp.AAC.2
MGNTTHIERAIIASKAGKGTWASAGSRPQPEVVKTAENDVRSSADILPQSLFLRHGQEQRQRGKPGQTSHALLLRLVVGISQRCSWTSTGAGAAI